jgi:predicted nucleic acid-binding protein
MSRIFWDTMLFIYLLEDNAQFALRVRELLDRCYDRGDVLLTSHFAVGEVMAGSRMTGSEARNIIVEMGFSFVPFDGNCVVPFSRLRGNDRLRAPDWINLACAAGAGVDMFLTGDRQLLKRGLHIPGIHFITDFNLPIL